LGLGELLAFILKTKKMGNTKEYADSIQQLIDKIHELQGLISSGEYAYKMEFVLKNHASLFDRFCPHKVGDRVALSKDLGITQDAHPGWFPSKHFLMVGAVGTVINADYYEEKFRFGVSFDDDSWIDLKGVVRPRPDHQRGVYVLSEDVLEPFPLVSF
jgi:hypothetical protein